MLGRNAPGAAWRSAVGTEVRSHILRPENLNRFAVPLDLLATDVAPHIWDLVSGAYWQPRGGDLERHRQSLIDLASNIILQVTLRYVEPPARDHQKIVRKRASFRLHARTLARLIAEEINWSTIFEIPADAFRPDFRATLTAIEATPDARTDGRKTPMRGPSLATMRAIYAVCALRVATGGELKNVRYPFPIGGMPFYRVAAAFLAEAGIRGMTAREVKKNVEQAKAAWKLYVY